MHPRVFRLPEHLGKMANRGLCSVVRGATRVQRNSNGSLKSYFLSN
ncbi:hypothetical protein [Alysiella crassa]|nr:hypothetical protein [Alysiella crassa]